VGSGVAELVGVEAFDAGKLSATTQRASETVVAEPCSAFLPQPEIGGVRVAVVQAEREVAAERASGGGSDRDNATSAAFAAADDDQTGREVEVLGP
jgi:hypothetical protein